MDFDVKWALLMAHVVHSIIVFLLAVHFAGAFFVFREKDRARDFITSVFAVEKVSEWKAGHKKPRIPFRILSPAHQTQMVFQQGQYIKLQANKSARWYVNDQLVGEGREVFWTPGAAGRRGTYLIQAALGDREQTVMVFLK